MKSESELRAKLNELLAIDGSRLQDASLGVGRER